jgi:hypothetical protein
MNKVKHEHIFRRRFPLFTKDGTPDTILNVPSLLSTVRCGLRKNKPHRGFVCDNEPYPVLWLFLMHGRV